MNTKKEKKKAKLNLCCRYVTDGLRQPTATLGQFIAIDCEFVGVGPNRVNGVGRVSLVSEDGRILYDMMAWPEEPITDYRTPWSGIRPRDMQRAIPFVCLQEQVERLIKGRILVGHTIKGDLKALRIQHPEHLIRDISRCHHLRQQLANIVSHSNPISLKKMSEHLLNRHIQKAAHCSVEDARATMDLYKLVMSTWETDIRRRKEDTSFATISHSEEEEDSSCHVHDTSSSSSRNMSLTHTSSSHLLLDDSIWE